MLSAYPSRLPGIPYSPSHSTRSRASSGLLLQLRFLFRRFFFSLCQSTAIQSASLAREGPWMKARQAEHTTATAIGRTFLLPIADRPLSVTVCRVWTHIFPRHRYCVASEWLGLRSVVEQNGRRPLPPIPSLHRRNRQRAAELLRSSANSRNETLSFSSSGGVSRSMHLARSRSLVCFGSRKKDAGRIIPTIRLVGSSSFSRYFSFRVDFEQNRGVGSVLR